MVVYKQKRAMESDLTYMLGLELIGKSPEGLFKTFGDKYVNIRIKIHPPDSMAPYSHLHIR